MSAIDLVRRLDGAGVVVSLNPSGGLHLSGQRPPAALLDDVRTHKAAIADLLATHRARQIGADLIPRAAHDDERYAGVDLAARALDTAVLESATARLALTPEELHPDMLATVDRIAAELQSAGLEEIGRWATDCQYAYSEIRNIAPATEAAMFHAWYLSIGEYVERLAG